MLMLALLACGLMALSGVASLALPRSRGAGDWAFAVLMVLASGCGLVAALRTLESGRSEELATLAVAFAPAFRLDPLAAAFLLPVCVVPCLAALYGTAYWSETHERSARRVRS